MPYRDLARQLEGRVVSMSETRSGDRRFVTIALARSFKPVSEPRLPQAVPRADRVYSDVEGKNHFVSIEHKAFVELEIPREGRVASIYEYQSGPEGRHLDDVSLDTLKKLGLDHERITFGQALTTNAVRHLARLLTRPTPLDER
jgi:hypothetical protein